MPHSIRENDALVLDFVKDSNIKTVLDVGCGAGTYADILSGVCTLDAIEVWEPYVEQFNLHEKYRSVFIGDVRTIRRSNDWNHSYDLVIFGDVLEHLTADEARMAWYWAHRVARWGLISVPIIHYPQDGTENPHEAHLQEHLTVPQVIAEYGPMTGFQVYEVTGTFIKRFGA